MMNVIIAIMQVFGIALIMANTNTQTGLGVAVVVLSIYVDVVINFAQKEVK